MNNIQWVFGSCIVTSLLLIAAALHFWGAAEVRDDGGEIFFLTFFGGFWIMMASRLFPWLGLSFRDDAVERRNTAALVALCGAVVAVALIYTGGSLGEGPSYLNNVFSAGLGTAGLILLWLIFELVGAISVSIAEERDLASGVRMCGLLLAVGLLLGRAVAGDWHSEEATVHDFARDGWPALVVCAFALGIERFVRPGPHRPIPAWKLHGLVPALGYLACAGIWLWKLGPWEGMPR